MLHVDGGPALLFLYMYTWLCCLCFWAMFLTETRYKTRNKTKNPTPD